MKIRDVLDYVIELQEPAFSETVLLRWLNQVEAEIQTEVLLLAVDGIVQYSAEDLKEGSNTELIVPAPFSKLYEDYLLWRIALGQGEAERANNLETIYHESYLAYVRFVCDTISPGSGRADQIRYYLTAYQIAVKNGFVGSEIEWIESLKGANGEPGAGLRIVAQVASENVLPSLENTEEDIGKGYLVGFGTSALLYIWDGKKWFYKTQLSGKGDKGEQGEQGLPGVGIQSIAFKSATASGNVYTVTLTNRKTYDFVAPSGPTGPIGPTGKTGACVDVEYDAASGTVTIINGEGGEGGAGADGVGIHSIVFKATTDDGNVYTIILTDGSTYDVVAPKGDVGSPGKDGRGIASVEYDAKRDVLIVNYDDDTSGELTGFGTWMKADTYDPDGKVAAAGGIQKFVEENVPGGSGSLVEVDTSAVTVSSGELLKLQYVKIGRLVHISMVVDQAERGKTLIITLPSDVPHALYKYWTGLQYIPAFVVFSSEKRVSTFASVRGIQPGYEQASDVTDIIVDVPTAEGVSNGEVWISGSYITAY